MVDLFKLKQHYHKEYHTFITENFYLIKNFEFGENDYLSLGFVNVLEYKIINDLISGSSFILKQINSQLRERQYIILLKEKTENLEREEIKKENLLMLKIKYNKKYTELKHAQILGTLLHNNFEFSQFGDIIVTNEADIFIEVKRELGEYLLQNRLKINKTVVNFEVIKQDQDIRKKDPLEERIYVKSERCDTIIKSLCKVNRHKSQELISGKQVRINYEINTKTSKKINPEDVISIRKYGKFTIKEIKERKNRKEIIVGKEV